MGLDLSRKVAKELNANAQQTSPGTVLTVSGRGQWENQDWPFQIGRRLSSSGSLNVAQSNERPTPPYRVSRVR